MLVNLRLITFIAHSLIFCFSFAQTEKDLYSVTLGSPQTGARILEGSEVNFQFNILTQGDHILPEGCGLLLAVLELKTNTNVVQYVHRSPMDTISVSDLPIGNYLAILQLLDKENVALPRSVRAEVTFSVTSPETDGENAMLTGPLKDAMNSCKGIECVLLQGLVGEHTNGKPSFQVETVNFDADEVVKKELPVREWMLPRKESSDYVKCKLNFKNEKRIISIGKTSKVLDLKARVQETYKYDGNIELYDQEGYLLMENDELIGLADSENIVYIEVKGN